ncbi:hypothetical protein [Paractinoplanes hotanensis]|uniref:Uncharacterized protein n=1 Tax=Paractinoplanes hotanensis TaxID=2906497 RepID=A0ABT0Y0Z2_9ACTN|nr:hypothetical protein [Actinoplanes hotanensis]MCM4079705.1 hypothetical protein [Actinoplanes hotanensis]
MTSPVPVRPTVVGVAFWFQVTLVGLLLLTVGVLIADAIHYDGLIDQAARVSGADEWEVSAERDSSLGFTLLFGLPLLVLTVWLGATVTFVDRGSNVARILTWVGLSAPVALCLVSCLLGGFVGAIGVFAFSSLGEPIEGDDGEILLEQEWRDDGFYGRLYDLDSGGWSLVYDALLAFTAPSAALLAVAIIVLLATRQSGRYFRPDQGQRLIPYAGPALYHPAGAQPFPPPAPMFHYPPGPAGAPYPAPPHQHPWAPPAAHPPGPPPAFPPPQHPWAPPTPHPPGLWSPPTPQPPTPQPPGPWAPPAPQPAPDQWAPPAAQPPPGPWAPPAPPASPAAQQPGPPVEPSPPPPGE